MNAAVFCVIVGVVTVAPPIVHRRDVERLAPPSTWATTTLPSLNAQLVVLPTKAPNRFVVKQDGAAVATVEGAAPLFAPLDNASAAAVVDALAGGVVVDVGAIDRVKAAGFAVSRPLPPEPPRYPFSFARLELRHPDSAPALVHVLLDLDAAGHVDRSEHVVARVAVDVAASNAPLSTAPAPDHSTAIARFVAAARARR